MRSTFRCCSSSRDRPSWARPRMVRTDKRGTLQPTGSSVDGSPWPWVPEAGVLGISVVQTAAATTTAAPTEAMSLLRLRCEDYRGSAVLHPSRRLPRVACATPIPNCSPRTEGPSKWQLSSQMGNLSFSLSPAATSITPSETEVAQRRESCYCVRSKGSSEYRRNTRRGRFNMYTTTRRKPERALDVSQSYFFKSIDVEL
mmetsp:Transcript_6859/g.15640  ORF Transcript_6859/g.15640 Transcript_6859/m.15640 type:complete len:200 (+) Transcript_6859:287-886(+)